jgi:hypothetical protein
MHRCRVKEAVKGLMLDTVGEIKKIQLLTIGRCGNIDQDEWERK